METESNGRALKRAFSIGEILAHVFKMDEGPSERKRLRLSPIERQTPSLTKDPKLYLELLDTKILAKIFDHLELYDLLQMCNEGEHFRKIIAEKVMPHRVLNISEIHKSYSVRHAFKYLGQFAREVSIKQSDIQWKNEKFSVIEEILRLIGKRCAAGHLKKVSIVFDMNNVKSYNLNTEIPDCMKTIETLRIVQNCSRSENLDECVTGLLTGCSQLQSLILERFNSSGIFLSALHKMSQLRELTLDVFCLSKITCWQEFIQKPIPTLKSFCCSNMIIYGTGSFYEQALDQIMTAFPAIERLSCDNNVSFYSSDKLDALASMKSLHIKSSCIDGNVMKAIQKMTSLEELSIHIQYGNSYHCGGFIRQNGKQWLEALAGLKKLHSIKIQMGRQMAFSWDDVIEWLSELPSVTDICLIGFQSFRKKHIENIVSLSPELRCVKLGMPTTSLTRTLYQNLVQNRNRWFRKSPQLNIHLLDEQSVRKLKQSIISSTHITNYESMEKCIRLMAFK